MQRLAGDNVKALNGIKESDITYIVPVSEEMNGTFELQEHILAKELQFVPSTSTSSDEPSMVCGKF